MISLNTIREHFDQYDHNPLIGVNGMAFIGLFGHAA